jgi:hypothetical protein
MPATGPLSPAQLVGYAAFLIGVVSFLQRDDRRLRAMIGLQAFSYAVHFFLLGSAIAAFASLVTCARALLSLYTRSRWVALGILVVNLTFGALTVRTLAGLLPVLASSAGTVAFFWFSGLTLRLVLLASTACWLANNVLVGSIGGTLLELFIGVANGITCYRLWRASRSQRRSLRTSRTSHAPESA